MNGKWRWMVTLILLLLLGVGICCAADTVERWDTDRKSVV